MTNANTANVNSSYEIRLSLSEELSLYQRETLIGEKKVKLQNEYPAANDRDFKDKQTVKFDHSFMYPTIIQLANSELIKDDPCDESSTSRVMDLSDISLVDKLLSYSQISQLAFSTKPRRKALHRPRRVSTPTDRPYKCAECPSSFASKGNLKFHSKTVHEKLTMYPCPKCDASFSQKGNFKTHFNSVHLQIRPFECLICEAVFSQKGNLKTHLNKMHYSDTNVTDTSLVSKCPPPKKRGRPPTISSK